MYVIIVYDVDQKRVSKVCQFLRRFLHWVQNSAFEGELTEAQLEEVRLGLKEIIEQDYDSVYIYTFQSKKQLKKEILGQEKSITDNILE